MKTENLSFFGIHLQYLQGEIIRVLNRCKYIEKNMSERKLKDTIATEITYNYNTCDIVYSRALYSVLKLLQNDITGKMFNNNKSLTDFDELEDFQKQVQSLYEDSLRPVLTEFQKYLLSKNDNDTWFEMMKSSKNKDKGYLKSWLRLMQDNLKNFIQKFEINKKHFLHEITDTNKNRINLAFSIYRQLKKRERAITQLTLPFTVTLNNTLSEDEREKKKINKTIVLDVDIFNKKMLRLWKKSPEHMKQFDDLDRIAEERSKKTTFIPTQRSKSQREIVQKDPVKYTTMYNSILAVPNVYLD